MNRPILSAKKLNTSENWLPVEKAGLRAEMTICGEGSANRPVTMEIAFTAAEDFAGVVRIALPVAGNEPRFFLPGFMYGTNRGEAPLLVDSKCPRLRRKEDFPASPWWTVRSDRLSHPAALAWSEGRVTGFAASPYYLRQEDKRLAWQPGAFGAFDQYAGFGCSLEPGQLIYTLGYENAPWFFLDSHKYFPAEPITEENVFRISAGESFTVHLDCFDYPAEDERGIHDALHHVYNKYHEPPRTLCTAEETIRQMATAIARDAWLPDKHLYSCFVFDREDGFEYRLLPSIAWTNGVAAAVPMLLSAHHLKDETIRAQALDCIDHIVRHSINPRSGLPYMAEEDGVWSNAGWWYRSQRTPGHAAYLVGQCVYLILLAYAREQERGAEHAEWLAFARDILTRTEQTRNSDGEYPYVLSEKTGAGLEYDSFSSTWLLAAAAYYCHLTGERKWLKELCRSEEYYHQAYIRRQECYAGPLDIDKNVDSEGILAYIRAARYLHMMTHDESILSRMQDALHYEFTFKFCYNSPIKVPPLSKVGWSSCGGSLTSVTNPHIHPMSSSVIGEMEYFLFQREDAYIRSRLMDTLLWSCQCHATHDGEYGYGKIGWMSERFCHSQGLLTETYPDGSPASTWFALMPWACGSILEGLNAHLRSK